MSDPQARLQTLLLLDLVDSTGLIERLGDLKAAEHLRRHDRFVRDLLKVHGGREIDKTDGFLLVFERPVQAAAFALTYQRGLKDNPELPLRSRIGVHVGEVVMYENSAEDVAAGAKSVELEGLAKPIAARLMSLALPGQILLSDVVHTLVARAHSELEQRFPGMTLRDHGLWHLKGVHEAMHVYELGEPGVAPFQRPVDVEKVRHDRRRLVLGSVAAGTVVAAGGGGWWWWHNRPIHIPFEKRDWVVVGELVNETGQELLDDSLDQAFRVALEQSQVVNVVPELQLRDALKRMRVDDPNALRDRARLCEISLREGARALVMARVANHGDSIRITSELIDPNTARTIAQDTADAAGIGMLVNALDLLVRSLRLRFGEERAVIERETLPLAQVTSADLEALRSYSLGLKAFTRGEYDEARALLEHALDIDREFAAAYAKLSGIHFVMGRLRDARSAAEQAAAVKDRLTARERLYVEGTLTLDQPPARMLEKWTLLARMFPDFKVGQHNCGYVEWQYQNRFDSATQWLEGIAQTRFPQQPVSLNLLGYTLLGEERLDQADQAFAQAQELSGSHYAFGRADALLALGRIDEARRLLEAPRPATDLFAAFYDLRQVALLSFSGRYAAAIEMCRRSAQQVRSPGQKSRLRLIELQLMEIAIRPVTAEAMEAAVATELAALALDPLSLDYAPAFQLALLGALLARQGQLDKAQSVGEQIRARLEGSGYFFRERAMALLDAELALAAGPATPIESVLLPTHDPRRLIAEDDLRWRAQPQTAEVTPVIRTLAGRLGRAFAEWNEGFVCQMRNLHLVQQARLHCVEAEPKVHAEWLSSLRRQWHAADDHPLKLRLDRIRA